MEPYILRSGKRLPISLIDFYVSFNDLNAADLISVKFYTQYTEQDRLDIIELYLEYFLRQIYHEVINNTGAYSAPIVRQTGSGTSIRSFIDGSAKYIELFIENNSRNVSIEIAEEDCTGVIHVDSSIRFKKYYLNLNDLKTSQNIMRDCVDRIRKSIAFLSPEILVWWQFQGVNLITNNI